MSTELAVETTELVKAFGDNRAVDGVDLAVPAGTVHGVLGPNGAGKTSLGWSALFVVVFGAVTLRLYDRK